MWFISVFLLGFGAVILWVGFRATKDTPGDQTESSPLRKVNHVPDALPVFTGQQLLGRSGNARLVTSILGKTGLSEINSQEDVLPLLTQYAEFVQLLPASESHHHAQPGGLLEHTLEVIDFALSYRKQKQLPVHPSSEYVNERKHAWTYATMVAAMFHDVGKPMTDVLVTLYGTSLPRSGKAWQPMAGGMASQGAQHYQVAFNSERKYSDHSQLSLMLMQRIMPPKAMAWLSGHDPNALKEVLDCLGSSPKADGVLYQFLKRADMESTRLNLLSGSRTRFKSAREVSLIDVLDEGLRRLLGSGLLSLNRPGGHGFVWGGEQGQGDLLLVCPRVVDELRKYLGESLIEGSRGVPQDNLIVYGSWLDFDRIRVWKDQSTEAVNSMPRAVWRVNVQGIPKPLAVLRFPRNSATMAGIEDWPQEFSGEITVVEADTDTQEIEAVHAVHVPPAAVTYSPAAVPSAGTQNSSQTPEISVHQVRISEHEATLKLLQNMSYGDGLLPSDAGTAWPAPLSDGDAVLNHALPATTAIPGMAMPSVSGLDFSGAAPTSARSIVAKPKPVIPSMKIKTRELRPPELDAFEDWLTLGLSSRQLPYNAAQALIHFHQNTDEKTQTQTTCALLVTPAIYQRFIKELQAELWSKVTNLSEIPKSAWVPLQTAFLKHHAHRMSQSGKIRQTVFRYATKSGGVFSANVLTEPGKIFMPLPEANPFIAGEVQASSLLAAAVSRSQQAGMAAGTTT